MNDYPKGYSALYKTMDYEPENKDLSEKIVDTLKIHYFEDFIRLAQNKGISLVCCISPSYKAPADDNKYESIKSLCIHYQVPFLYYGSESSISNEKSFFQDRTHLNDCGARRYTSKLMSWIRNRHFIFNKYNIIQAMIPADRKEKCLGEYTHDNTKDIDIYKAWMEYNLNNMIYVPRRILPLCNMNMASRWLTNCPKWFDPCIAAMVHKKLDGLDINGLLKDRHVVF